MSDKPVSLDDLCVVERSQAKGWGTSSSYRPATREDVLTVVRELEALIPCESCEGSGYGESDWPCINCQGTGGSR